MRAPLPGLRPDSLMGYLAALGLGRVLTLADPRSTTWWHEGVLIAETDCGDLVDLLVRDYRPTPVVSPWNGGSGYGQKDQKQREAVASLAGTGSERLAAYARTHEVARRVIAEAAAGDWTKQRVVQEMRNRCPDEVVPWIDTSVVLTSQDQVRFPPLAGTGGNDGRLEFSSNFHQRLSEVLPELGARERDTRAWADDLLRGTSTQPLKTAAAGQFDGLAAGGPGSWSFGAADSLVNPWAYVLMIEGMLRFAASPAKRLGEAGSRPRSLHGPGQRRRPRPGAHDEESRGEVWAPLWDRPLTGRDLDLLFGQAKASWDGDAVRKSAHMYAAVRSFGVDRRISRFLRFGLAQRNGLAFVAVLLDEVPVHTADGIDLAVPVERRMRAFRATESSSATIRRVLRS